MSDTLMARLPVEPKRRKRQKRKRAQRKPKRKTESRYEQFKAEWERRRRDFDRGAGDWLIDKPELPLDAAPFFRTRPRACAVRLEQADGSG